MSEPQAHSHSQTHQWGPSTNAIHAGYEPDSLYGSINIPIYASTTFAQDDLAVTRNGYEYTRVGNPTITSLEKAVAAMEGATYGVAFSSGMAAVDTVLRVLLRPGDHVVIGNDAYGGTYRLLVEIFHQWDITSTVVDLADLAAVEAAILPNTRVIWAETPTNPLLSICDIAGLAEARDRAAAALNHAEGSRERPRLVVDNTFASPYLQQPLSLGADIVLHSTTKYIGGHSDVVGGLVCSNEVALEEEFRFFFGWVGAIPSPFDTYLSGRGLKTLSVRMERHCDNAEAVAEFLQGHPAVARVRYPGLPDHPGHEIAVKQMKRFGAMVSVEMQTEEQAKALCRNTELFCLAESLGGVESLIEHPSTMTHLSVVGSALAVKPELVRLSVGIEDKEDLLADLGQALGKLG
ncbi:cystathionine gamma-synthase [Corynebacterium aquatimens]|uniref:Cystathionine gamma-synthase n=1 Tax=Corynebacterium aquatimens TaxID=1190508 RepID=A0A931GRP4_9CORY|nr:cystathionine gamma-synthase [Corynebacterium aquatimens]MBG6122203.1 cystathionine gamma-synthase [Corynebacterium aquatimens]WJY65256.1 Cystathionine gamma-synthase [Corynebacterium aquatimens]